MCVRVCLWAMRGISRSVCVYVRGCVSVCACVRM